MSKYFDWGFIFKVFVAIIALNFLVDLFEAFVAPGIGTIYTRPFTWLKTKINPPQPGS